MSAFLVDSPQKQRSAGFTRLEALIKLVPFFTVATDVSKGGDLFSRLFFFLLHS